MVDEFSKLVINHSNEIEHWLRARWIETPPPFYASVDIRNSGYQITTVDTNLFPAGFNNLHETSTPLVVQAFSNAIESICPKAMRVLLIPENHTRNQYYLSNVWHLQNLLQTAGVDVRLGSVDPEVTSAKKINVDGQFIKSHNSSLNYELNIYPVSRAGDRLVIDDENGQFDSCMVLLNNDLTGGVPEALQNLGMTVYPPPNLGWHIRKKSNHFNHFKRVTSEFAKQFDFPETIVQSDFEVVDGVDFRDSETLKPLIASAEKLFERLQKKHQDQGIPNPPYIVIKSDAGTYGMAVMAINSVDELTSLNRKARNKLAVGKEGKPTRRILLQEGVRSIEHVNEQAAEQVIYLVGNCAVGGFYRIHPEKNNSGILNSPGMHFQEIPFTNCCNIPEKEQLIDSPRNRHYVAGIIARLAALAASAEIYEVNGKTDIK